MRQLAIGVLLMKPGEYFPKLYLKDLAVFLGKNVTGTGPRWMFCGRTTGRLLLPEYSNEYNGREEFVATLYELNLINQGIHAHFPEDFRSWCATSTPFPDCQECPHMHGGIHSPNSILEFCKNGSYYFLDQIAPVCVENKILVEYTAFFFYEYLKQIEQTAHFKVTSSEGLIEQLKNDSDCMKFRELI